MEERTVTLAMAFTLGMLFTIQAMDHAMSGAPDPTRSALSTDLGLSELASRTHDEQHAYEHVCLRALVSIPGPGLVLGEATPGEEVDALARRLLFLPAVRDAIMTCLPGLYDPDPR